jgi:nitrilase
MPVVVKPTGAIDAGPLHRDRGILYAEIDADTARRARRSVNVCGRYARPAIFSLTVNRSCLLPTRKGNR